MSKTFATPKGTTLQISDIKGKDYLTVQQRLIWFREERADWSIETEFVEMGATSAVVKATVKDQQGRILATSHKHEDKQGFSDFREKAETGAIGRALALVGYGTQFAVDLDEGDRIVDAPRVTNGSHPPESAAVNQEGPLNNSLASSYIVNFGKKHMGKLLNQMTVGEIGSYRTWLIDEAKKSGKSMNYKARDFVIAADSYLKDLHNAENSDRIPY